MYRFFFFTHSSKKMVLIKSPIVDAVLDSSGQSSIVANATVDSLTPNGFASKHVEPTGCSFNSTCHKRCSSVVSEGHGAEFTQVDTFEIEILEAMNTARKLCEINVATLCSET